MSRGKCGGLIVVALCLAIAPYCFCETYIVNFQQTDPPVEFVCSDLPDSTVVTWKLNGTDIKEKKEFDKNYAVFENNTLRLLKVEPNTVGPYTCSDGANNVVAMTFNMKVRAHVTQFEKPRNVIEGDPLSLDCRAWGVPEPVITWHRNGSQIVADGSKITFKKNTEPTGSGTKFPVLENATLRIEEMTYEEGGNYTCHATNVVDEDGEEEVATTTVLVQIKDKYAALWPFLGICVEVAVLCTIILIYEKRRAKRIEEEEREEEATHLNANNDVKTPLNGDDVRQRK